MNRKSKSFKHSKYDDYDVVEDKVKKFDHRRRKRKAKDPFQSIDTPEQEETDAKLSSNKS